MISRRQRNVDARVDRSKLAKHDAVRSQLSVPTSAPSDDPPSNVMTQPSSAFQRKRRISNRIRIERTPTSFVCRMCSMAVAAVGILILLLRFVSGFGRDADVILSFQSDLNQALDAAAVASAADVVAGAAAHKQTTKQAAAPQRSFAQRGTLDNNKNNNVRNGGTNTALNEIDPSEESPFLTSSIASHLTDDHLLRELTEWVKANGGYVNDKIQLRRADVNDPSSVRGIFANEDVSEGETLFTIPWDLMYHTPATKKITKTSPKSASVRKTRFFDPDTCKMYEQLYRDMHSETPSPYAKYLMKQTRNYIPPMWTDGGKETLQALIGPSLPPSWQVDNMYRHNFVKGCAHIKKKLEDEEGDAFDAKLWDHAWMLATSRSDDEILTPIYCMINHANGERYNVRHEVDYGVTFSLVSTKDVVANGQYFSSYNKCNTCQGWDLDFGTPDLFLWFGFIEDYPQLYVMHDSNPQNFHAESKKKKPLVEIEIVDDNGQETTVAIQKIDKYRLKFGIERDPVTNVPHAVFHAPLCKTCLAFLQEQHKFLATQHRHKGKLTKPDGMPQWEWDGAWNLHDAYLNAITLALEKAKTTTLSEEVWESAGWFDTDTG